jgi:hypothetical protein
MSVYWWQWQRHRLLLNSQTPTQFSQTSTQYPYFTHHRFRSAASTCHLTWASQSTGLHFPWDSLRVCGPETVYFLRVFKSSCCAVFGTWCTYVWNPWANWEREPNHGPWIRLVHELGSDSLLVFVWFVFLSGYSSAYYSAYHSAYMSALALSVSLSFLLLWTLIVAINFLLILQS